MATFAPVARLHTGADSLRQLAFVAESTTLLAATSDGRLLKWDLSAADDGRSQKPQTLRVASCSAFAIDPSWGCVAIGGADGQLALWPLNWKVRCQS